MIKDNNQSKIVLNNCIAHDNGGSGFYSEGEIDVDYNNCLAYRNGQDGFKTVQAKSDDLHNLVEELLKRMDEWNLNAEDKEELRSDIYTIQAQLKSPKQKNNIIKESLLSVRNIVEGSAGSALYASIMMAIGSIS